MNIIHRGPVQAIRIQDRRILVEETKRDHIVIRVTGCEQMLLHRQQGFVESVVEGQSVRMFQFDNLFLDIGLGLIVLETRKRRAKLGIKGRLEWLAFPAERPVCSAEERRIFRAGQ